MDELSKTLLSTSAQALKGILENRELKTSFFKKKYGGIMDFWYRGVNLRESAYGDTVVIDCQISPYTQLFPCNPFTNGIRWNKLYSNGLSSQIKQQPMETIAFYVSSDLAIRTQPIGDFSVIGLYERYGYIGEGILASIESKKLLSIIPDFYDIDYWGSYVRVTGVTGRFPVEHSIVIQDIAKRANLKVNFERFSTLPCIRITNIKCLGRHKRTCTLLGSPWVATTDDDQPFQVRYGYFSSSFELESCLSELEQISNISVYFDDFRILKNKQSFSEQFMN